jgi:hypothetical protein
VPEAGGQCYDHYFRRCSSNLGEKFGNFLQNQCFDQFWAENSDYFESNSLICLFHFLAIKKYISMPGFRNQMPKSVAQFFDYIKCCPNFYKSVSQIFDQSVAQFFDKFVTKMAENWAPSVHPWMALHGNFDQLFSFLSLCVSAFFIPQSRLGAVIRRIKQIDAHNVF